MNWYDGLMAAENAGVLTLYGAVKTARDARHRNAQVFVGDPKTIRDAKGKGHSFVWGDVARELVMHLPGMVIVSNNSGLTWINGHGGVKGRIIPLSVWGAMAEEGGYDCVESLLGDQIDPLYYATPGAAASLLLKYACDPQPYEHTAEVPLKGLTYGYHRVEKGRFEKCLQWDATGFYYLILRRLKSPHCLPHEGGVHYYGLNEWQTATWRNMVSAVADSKSVRNAIVGVMNGGKEEKPAYIRDKTTGKARLIHLKSKFGPLRQAGQTIIRIGYELCRAECRHSGSVYSIIDCVTLPDGGCPALWPHLGLNYRLRRSGGGEFWGRGSYRIGNYRTRLYELGYNPDEGSEESPGYGSVSYAAAFFGDAGQECKRWLTV